jgi:hypothetical protein
VPSLPDASDIDLQELWDEFMSGRCLSGLARNQFLQYLRELVSDPAAIDDVEFCDGCTLPTWDDEMSTAHGAVRICDSCWEENWSCCDRCDERYHDDDLTVTLSGSGICHGCRDSNYTYCDECEGYYPDEYSGDHNHSSCCESPQLTFAIRNDGCEPLANDTRVTITLPAGAISAEGVVAIQSYLQHQGLFDLSYRLHTLGDLWQARTGNYAKRLSRLAHVEFQAKLTQEVMSQVGCIARDHSNQVSISIEVTRDLNLSPEDFANEGSCWWNSYSESRCALKTNGGFGLRSFSGDRVTGRAWVLPLRLNDPNGWLPTFDTMTPDAFVVFNGYGDLGGYAAARIVAHLAGWTYRKIGFECLPMYVNAGGYLIAPENIAEQYTDGSLDLRVNQHSDLFGNEKPATDQET